MGLRGSASIVLLVQIQEAPLSRAGAEYLPPLISACKPDPLPQQNPVKTITAVLCLNLLMHLLPPPSVAPPEARGPTAGPEAPINLLLIMEDPGKAGKPPPMCKPCHALGFAWVLGRDLQVQPTFLILLAHLHMAALSVVRPLSFPHPVAGAQAAGAAGNGAGAVALVPGTAGQGEDWRLNRSGGALGLCGRDRAPKGPPVMRFCARVAQMGPANLQNAVRGRRESTERKAVAVTGGPLTCRYLMLGWGLSWSGNGRKAGLREPRTPTGPACFRRG